MSLEERLAEARDSIARQPPWLRGQLAAYWREVVRSLGDK